MTSPPDNSSNLDKENPFAGLRTFEEADQDFFFGRTQEVNDFYWRVHKNNTTICFGRSGLGKSSLILAGLFPRLRKKRYFPIYIRLGYRQDSPPLASQVLLQSAVAGEEAGVSVPDPRPGESLWEYFHRVEFWTSGFEILKPVLVFDQFEELFTLTRPHDSSRLKFVEELSDLVENRIPKADAKRLGEMEEPEFSFDDQNYRVVLTLREDFLPDLENLRSGMPSIGRNRMRLLPMNGQSAMEVVTQIEGLATDDVAERIVRWVASNTDTSLNITSLNTDPALLSIFCRELNKDRLAKGLDSFTSSLLDERGGKILDDFYDDTLADYANQEAVRLLLEEQLLTDSGRRIPVAMEDVLAREDEIDSDCINELIDDRLIRRYERDGVVLLELTHDLLTKAITDSRDRRRQHEAEQELEASREKRRIQAEQHEAKLKSQRLRTVGWAAIAVVSVGLCLYAYQQKELADQQKELADVALEKARKVTVALLKLEEVHAELENESDSLNIRLESLVNSAERLEASIDSNELDSDKVKPLLTIVSEINEARSDYEDAKDKVTESKKDANKELQKAAATLGEDKDNKSDRSTNSLASSEFGAHEREGAASTRANIASLSNASQPKRQAAYRRLLASKTEPGLVSSLLDALDERSYAQEPNSDVVNGRFNVLRLLGLATLDAWTDSSIERAVELMQPEENPKFNQCNNTVSESPASSCPALGPDTNKLLHTALVVVQLAALNSPDREFRIRILRVLDLGASLERDTVAIEESLKRLVNGELSAVGRDLTLAYLLEVPRSIWSNNPALTATALAYTSRRATFGPQAKQKARSLERKIR